MQSLSPQQEAALFEEQPHLRYLIPIFSTNVSSPFFSDTTGMLLLFDPAVSETNLHSNDALRLIPPQFLKQTSRPIPATVPTYQPTYQRRPETFASIAKPKTPSPPPPSDPSSGSSVADSSVPPPQQKRARQTTTTTT